MAKTTTRDDVREWIARAPEGTRWMLVICNTYDYSDYPVYFSDAQACLARVDAAQEGEYMWQCMEGKNLQRLMECYDLSQDIEVQLVEHRTMRLPSALWLSTP